jgi:hypothetical protein
MKKPVFSNNQKNKEYIIINNPDMPKAIPHNNYSPIFSLKYISDNIINKNFSSIKEMIGYLEKREKDLLQRKVEIITTRVMWFFSLLPYYKNDVRECVKKLKVQTMLKRK